MVHPGCGKSSKGIACLALHLISMDLLNKHIILYLYFFFQGKGFNSVGTFCEGWAGNCGEGGKGASSWYLMCDTCRDKYE